MGSQIVSRTQVLICAVLVLSGFVLSPAWAQTTVFINEIHYDNTGGDVGEAIEIAGPAGADLTGWSLVLYNGNGGASYATIALGGAIPDLCNGFGVLSFAAVGLQNGSPDGIALVNASSTVVQFLSYEGTFTAVGGPANGMTSTDIGVSETGSEPVGQSLQLSGTGAAYEDFSWNSPQTASFDTCNTNQTFQTPTTATVAFSQASYQFNEDGTAVGAAVTVNRTGDVSGAASVDVQFIDITATGGAALGAGVDYINTTQTLNFIANQTSAVVAISINDDAEMEGSEGFTLTLANAVNADIGAPNSATVSIVDNDVQLLVVINEIHADPSATQGDANGDGAVNTSQDEFVEIVNVSGDTLDMSGWTLSDGFGLRHTFPSGTKVPHECAVVVFAGGTPTGSFGHSVVQTASSGQLGLNNTGDTVTLNNGTLDVASYTFGGEGGQDVSLTRSPDITGAEPLVLHTTASGSGGRRFSPGLQLNGALFPGCPVPLKEIFEIQGNGLASPFAGDFIRTENNIVTAVGADGFFIQTPDDRADADANTSNGIFVFTGSAPGVAVGDNVNVTGLVQEFFNFTEFSSNPTVTVNSSGHPLPAVVAFNGSTPSPNQPQSAVEFERFEGMLIHIAAGVVSGPNQQFGSDPIAEVFIVAKNNRAFREPGIAFPGLPGLPVWDGNPEVFELDPNRLGLPNAAIPAGSTYEATGVLGFEFSDYELWPTQLTVDEATLPRPVRARNSGEFMVATFNMERFFDDVDDPAIDDLVPSPSEYAGILSKYSEYIREVLRAPDILALQEVENLNALQDLAAQIQSDDGSVVYSAFLEEGNDQGGIDVGYLVRNTVTVPAVAQLHKSEIFPFDNSLLHDRPPLLLQAELPDGRLLTLLNLHQRSLSGIEDSDSTRVRLKRHTQAVSVSKMVDSLQTQNPDINLIVLGDFNAFQFTDGYVHVLGQIMGAPASASEAQIAGTDEVDPDLRNEVLQIPASERYSFVFDGSAQVLDHILTSEKMQPQVSGRQYARGNADAAAFFKTDYSTVLRASDHDALVMYVAPLAAPAKPFLLLAEKSISFSKHTLSEGDIHSNNAIIFKPGHPSTHDGNVTAVGKIKIKIDNTIDGDVTSGGSVQNSGTVTGTVTEHAPVANAPLPVLSFSAGGDNQTVPVGGTLALAPGSYNNVKVLKNGALQLSSGEYFMQSLFTDGGSTLELDVSHDEIIINVVGLLSFGKNMQVVIVPGGESASDQVTFNRLEGGALKILSGAKVLGSIIAPNAIVSLANDVRFKGAICAKTINVNKRVTLLHHGSSASLPKDLLVDDSDADGNELAEIPTHFELGQNYPNPFNPSTTISFSVPKTGEVTLSIYNLRGQLVRTLVSGVIQVGRHRVVWDGADERGARAASGIYVYRMQADGFVASRKLVLMK